MQRCVLFAAAVVLGGSPAALVAQGFGVYEHGACAMGRGGTGVAAPCGDASAVYFNPAAISGLSGRRIAGGLILISAFGGFTDDLYGETTDLEDEIIRVPHLFVTYAASPTVGLGVGVFAPYGLETNWPTDFAGRFAGYHSRIQEIYVQPTVALQALPWLKVGVGVDIVFGSLELHQRVDLAEQSVPLPGVPAGTRFAQFGIPAGTDFADARLKGTGTAVTGHVGVQVRASDRLSLGARYLMKATVDYDGSVDFEQVATGIVIPADITVGTTTITAGTQLDGLITTLGIFNTVLADQDATTAVTNPEQLILGFAFRASDQLTVLGDYQLVRWSRFDEIELDFTNNLLDRTLYESFNDTHGFRIGGEWVRSERLTLRGGYLYHTAGAPDETVTPLLPEGTRNEITLGAGFRLGERVWADAAYQYVKQNDRRGRLRDPADGSPPTTALNAGLYTFGAHLFGVTLAYTF